MKPVIVPFFLNQLGCRHTCIYCAQGAINGQAAALPDAAEIQAKVAAYTQTAGSRPLEIAFYGGSFTCLPPRIQRQLLQPAATLVAAKRVQGIRLSTRPDAVGADEVALLVEYGVTTVELGVQSLDDRVLRAAGRGHDAAVVGPAIARLKSAGMQVGIQLMPGLPGDTPVSAQATQQAALAFAPAFLRIYPTVVLADTPLARAYAAGDYTPWSLEQTIICVKQMLLAALQLSVPILRIGLQETAALAAPGAVLAGPHHPALGALVQAALWRDLLLQAATQIATGPVELCCHPRRVSSLVGQKRSNLVALAQLTGLHPVRVRTDVSCTSTQLILTTPGGYRTWDLLKDLTYDHIT